jgi:hypothetical protein
MTRFVEHHPTDHRLRSRRDRPPFASLSAAVNPVTEHMGAARLAGDGEPERVSRRQLDLLEQGAPDTVTGAWRVAL